MMRPEGEKGYSLGEEIVHSITHGLGALLSVAAMTLLLVLSAWKRDPWRILGFSIYGISLVGLYLASTLYHAIPWPKAKRFFQRVDHLSIFLLIAGTYTPVTLIPLRGKLGWELFIAVWGLAVAGIFWESFFFGRYRGVSIALYLLMGWLIVGAFQPMVAILPGGLLRWLFLGGLFYSFGVVFYLLKRMPYHHAVWHLFVLGGSFCHFMGFMIYLA